MGRPQPFFLFCRVLIPGSINQAGVPRVLAVHCKGERGSSVTAIGLSKKMVASE